MARAGVLGGSTYVVPMSDPCALGRNIGSAAAPHADAHASLVRDTLITSLGLYAIFSMALWMWWPEYLYADDRMHVRAFGVSDSKTQGVFAGPVPLALAAILAGFIPLIFLFSSQKR